MEIAALDGFQAVVYALPFARLFGGAFQGAQARFDFGQQVRNTVGVVARVIEIAFGFRRFQLETGQIGGMLEEPAALLGPLAERGIDQALPDHRV